MTDEELLAYLSNKRDPARGFKPVRLNFDPSPNLVQSNRALIGYGIDGLGVANELVQQGAQSQRTGADVVLFSIIQPQLAKGQRVEVRVLESNGNPTFHDVSIYPYPSEGPIMGAGDTTSHSFLVEGSSTAAGASLEPTTLFSLPTRDGERLKRLAGTGPQTKARTDINPVAVPTLVKWASTPPIFSCKTDMKDLEREEEEIRRTLPPPNPKPIP